MVIARHAAWLDGGLRNAPRRSLIAPWLPVPAMTH